MDLIKHFIIIFIYIFGMVFHLCTTAIVQADIFKVDTFLDESDDNPADGVCQTTSGTCSLRAAVEQANALAGYDYIKLPEGTYALNLGHLIANDDITIFGAGADITIITKNGIEDVGAIYLDGSMLKLGFVTITEVTGDSGGGIYNNGGNLIILNSKIMDNHAILDGGAIFNEGGNLTIRNSILSNNGSEGPGGCIYSKNGSVKIFYSQLSANDTNSYPGALYNYDGDVKIYFSSISSNHGNHPGGAIHNRGHMTIHQCVLNGNYSETAEGGGIYNDAAGVMKIFFTRITENEASTSGGGIWNSGVMTIGLCSITENRAKEHGGGIYNDSEGVLKIISSRITDNSVLSGLGGGIYNNEGKLHLVHTRVADNISDDCYPGSCP